MNERDLLPKARRNYNLWIIFIFLSSLINPTSLSAQDNEPIYQVIQLDSVVITASRNGFDVDDFIDMVVRDSSFYEAFRNLRTADYHFQNLINIYDNKGRIKSSYKSMAHQVFNTPCRHMEETNKVIEGNFFDKHGEYEYYTAKLYDRMFFTHGTVCKSENNSEDPGAGKPKGMEKHVSELKKLIFHPGQKASVPLIGNKTAIFEKDMLPYYNYTIQHDTLRHQQSYVFTVSTKPEYQDQQTGKTVIKNLQTWFSMENFQILKRQYTLEAKTLVYQFQVAMDIDVVRVNDKYYPSYISYDGTWKVAGKKREHAKFNIHFSNFKN